MPALSWQALMTVHPVFVVVDTKILFTSAESARRAARPSAAHPAAPVPSLPAPQPDAADGEGRGRDEDANILRDGGPVAS